MTETQQFDQQNTVLFIACEGCGREFRLEGGAAARAIDTYNATGQRHDDGRPVRSGDAIRISWCGAVDCAGGPP
jgi:hypothetical protein